MRQLIAPICCAAVAISCCTVSLSVSADDNSVSFVDGFEAVLQYYSPVSGSGSEFIGYHFNNTWQGFMINNGSTYYRAEINTAAAAPSWSYYSGASRGFCTIGSKQIYGPDSGYFYYDNGGYSSRRVLDFYMSTDENSVTQVYNYSQSYSDHSYTIVSTSGSSPSEAWNNYYSPDPTESDSSAGSSFQLPDSWISGGETLPEPEDVTFPDGFDPDSAFSQFEDMTFDVDDGVKTGLNFFWAFLIRIIDALGLWTYVFLALMFGLIVWMLKGV